MDPQLAVTIKSCMTAYPAESTPNLHIFLPSIDHTVVFMVDSVYFYSAGAEKAVQTLLNALQKAMVVFHPFAGRLMVLDQRLQIDCNSAGVPLVDAVSDLCIDELGDLSRPNPQFRNLVYAPQGVRSFSDWPLATFQITRFKCGGFSLGVSVNHALADGFSIIQFMQLFTSLARGEIPNNTISVSFDRSMLKSRNPPSPKYDFGDAYYKSSEVPSTQSFSTLEDMLTANLSASNYVVPDLVSKSLHVSACKVEFLKKLALSDGSVKRCSTFDVLAAYIWKIRTAAMGMSPEHESVMFMAVNVSGKTQPPLPSGFLGNRAFPVSVKLPAKQLLDKPLSYCVKFIQDTIAAVDDEYVRSWLDWSEIHRGIPKFHGGFYLSSWWKFPFYDMDFGFGKPIYMGPVLTQRVEFVLILPVSPTRVVDGGVDVLLTLSPHHMDKFQTFVNFPCM